MEKIEKELEDFENNSMVYIFQNIVEVEIFSFLILTLDMLRVIDKE